MHYQSRDHSHTTQCDHCLRLSYFYKNSINRFFLKWIFERQKSLTALHKLLQDRHVLLPNGKESCRAQKASADYNVSVKSKLQHPPPPPGHTPGI